MKKKLIFGDPKSIEKAREGMVCECGHSGSDHDKDWRLEDCEREAFNPKTIK